VAVVTVFSVSEKFLGFLYRIFLSRTIGSEGMGLYQVALSVFALLLTISCSGTPVTVSRLMTKYKAENNGTRVFKVITAGILVTFLTTLPICMAFFIFRNDLSFLFADERCVSVFLVVLPGLIFTSIYAVLRGVFWGNKDFLPYSIIELLEEICMIIVGIILIRYATTPFSGAFSAGVAVLVSYVFSFTLASIVFFIRKNKLKNPLSELKPLLQSAMPITAMRTANSFASSLVSIVLPLKLIASGFTESQAMSVFGVAMGQSVPLLFTPITLIGSFTLVLIPEISEHYYKKRYKLLKQDIERALKFTIITACLFIPLFTVCGQEIGIVVFDSADCGSFLTASAFLMLFMSLSNITTSMLNSMGFENKTLIFFIIGAVFMLLSIWILPPYMGIYSLIVGLTFVYGLTAVLNLILLNKKCVVKPKYLTFCGYSVLFLIPSILMGFLLKNLLIKVMGVFLSLVVTGLIVVIFNALLHLVFGVIKIEWFKTTIKNFGFSKKLKA